MLVSKNSAVLATRKWLLKEKAATQWLCLILICDVLPFGFVARLTCWPFCKIDIMSPLSLLPIPVPPASICLGLVGLQSNHLSHVNLQPNLGANRLFQFDDCFSNLFVWPPKKTYWKFSRKLLIGTPSAGNQGAIPLNVKHSTSRPWTTQNVKVATLFDLKSTWWLSTAVFHELFSIWEKKVMLPLTSRKWEISSTARVHFINHDGCSGFCDRWMTPISPGNYHH